MKTALLLACLITPAVALAQKDYTPLKEKMVTHLISKEKVGIYRTLSDTIKGKPDILLPPTDEVTILGQFNSRWAVVNKGGFRYFIPQQAIFGTTGIDVVAMEAHESAPLPVDPETHRIAYQKVVEVPGVSKADLYGRALEWIAKSYNSAQNVIQVQDKESGKIIVKALDRVSSRGHSAGVVHYTLSIYVKEGRYKYVFTDFTHDATAAPGFISGGPLELENLTVQPMGGKKPWTEIRRQAIDDASLLAMKLDRAMTLKGAKDPSDF